jgi:PD-(D/E)XK endonuclease
MEHPKDVGDRTTLAVMLALRHVGYRLLVPFGENTRYDLVVDDGSRLAKVQCKSGRLRAGVVTWSMCSNYAHHRHPRAVRRDYLGDVDYFGVYCPETCGVYLIPIEDIRCDEPDHSGSTRPRTTSGSSSATQPGTRSGAWASTRPNRNFR